MLLRGWRMARARGGRALRRRWSSTGGSKAPKDKAEVPSATVVRSRTPGVTRLRRTGGGVEKDLEVDSTIARIIGSDWGDRRGQTVSLPMRIYWVVFGLVLVNGVYTYFAGKDEHFLVDKLRKKVDEKVGNVDEPSEFEVIATGGADTAQGSVSSTTATVPTSSSPGQKAAAPTSTPSSTGAAPASIFTARLSASSPFFSPSVAARSPSPAAPRSRSKEELQAQLRLLRARQQSLRESLGSATQRQQEEMEHEIRMIDVQKAELKQALKRL